MKRRKILKRARVFRALESIFDYPLTIVEAPMGYGKTTAVKEFLDAGQNPVLWLTLAESEDTTSFFWESLTAEIQKLDRALAGTLKDLGFPLDAPQAANILTILGGMELQKNTVLVIDDYHLVKSPQIGEWLGQLVRRGLENLHLVVITRDTTNLDFAELVAKGLCNILSQHVVGFTKEETRAYCAMMNCMPPEEDFGRICEYADGWISLIYLLLLGLKKGIPIGMNNIIIDELVERVLYNPCGEPVRRFLLGVAVLDSFTEEQARFVTVESKTAEFLKKLRRENAFIRYDETEGVYKIHNMLLDFLRNKQKGDPRLKELTRRAGEWFVLEKAFTPAYRYFYRAGEITRILSLLNDEHNVTRDLAEFEGSPEMFAAMPRELLFEYPIATLQYICLLLLSGDPAWSKDGADRLDELQRVYEEREDFPPGLRNRVLFEIHIVGIFAAFNDVQKMIESVKKAARLQSGGVSCLIVRKSEFTFGSPHFLYSYYREIGKLKQTADGIAAGFPPLIPLVDGCGTGCEYAVLAEYALETGHWPEVEPNAMKALYKARALQQVGIVICVEFARIRFFLLEGKTAEALDLLSALRREVSQENNAVYNTTLDLCEGYVFGCLGQLDGIPLWLRRGDESSASFLNRAMAFSDIVYGKAVLLSKNFLELEMLTETFQQHFLIFHNQLGLLHNQIFKAAAQFRLYGPEKGCDTLKEALEMGREDHIVLPFAENAPAILEMLRTLAHTGSRDAYYKDVLSCCERYVQNLRRETPQAAVTLSHRERQVLALAAEGLRREDIAADLMVSTGTVRTHLQNIYRKLEADGKTAAIRKAQKLRLI